MSLQARLNQKKQELENQKKKKNQLQGRLQNQQLQLKQRQIILQQLNEVHKAELKLRDQLRQLAAATENQKKKWEERVQKRQKKLQDLRTDIKKNQQLLQQTQQKNQELRQKINKKIDQINNQKNQIQSLNVEFKNIIQKNHKIAKENQQRQKKIEQTYKEYTKKVEKQKFLKSLVDANSDKRNDQIEKFQKKQQEELISEIRNSLEQIKKSPQFASLIDFIRKISHLKMKIIREQQDKVSDSQIKKFEKKRDQLKDIISLCQQILNNICNLRLLQNRTRYLQKFCSILGLQKEDVASFFQLEQINKSKPIEIMNPKLLKTVPKIGGDLGRSFDDLLKDVSVDGKQKTKLLAMYKQYTNYLHHAKKLNLIDISNQSRQIKSTKKINIPQLLAFMNKANLLLEGFQLRPAQILAVLIFYYFNKNIFCQINTGEGKTTIIAMMAVIKVLQGKPVDVITSNQVLALQAVKEKIKFYAPFNISATTNNPSKEDPVQGQKNCYNYNIVYGTITNFQFDYLRHEVLLLKTKGTRYQSTIIIDEADNVVIDNAAHTARLSEPIAGFGSLKWVFLFIWKILCEVERIIEEKQKKELQIEDITKEIKDQMLKFLMSKDITKPFDQEMIPQFLKKYCKNKQQKLCACAIEAKYSMHPGVDYIVTIKTDEINKKDGQEVIIPIDQHVGVTLQSTRLTYLQSFLQLKHNLELTSQSLSSIFISNCSYLKLYSTIYGLTGTLGSPIQIKLIKQIYKADSIVIPPFQKSSLKYSPLQIKNTEQQWMTQIINNAANYSIINQRATLIICSTINDLLKIKEQIKQSSPFQQDDIVVYQDQRDVQNIDQLNKIKVKSGKVILATNIGGRGTDLKLDQEVLIKGGLHVIITFLASSRILKQAAGRAARKGDPGTSEIIIRKEDADKYFVKQGQNFQAVCQTMDHYEQNNGFIKTKQIKTKFDFLKSQLTSIENTHKIFLHFAGFFIKLQKNHINKMILQDLKAEWAFVFDSLDDKNAEQIIKTFFQKLKNIVSLGQKYNHTFQNPYYCLRYIQSILWDGINSSQQIDFTAKAREAFNQNCISSHVNTISAVHYTKFVLEIESIKALKHIFVKIVGKIIPINFSQQNKRNISQAQKALERAIAITKKQLEQFELITSEKILEYILLSQEDLPKPDKCYLTDHFQSEIGLIKLRLSHFEDLLEQIVNNKNQSIYLKRMFKIDEMIKQFSNQSQESQFLTLKNASSSQINEFKSQAEDIFCQLSVIKTINFKDPIIVKNLTNIGIGIASLALNIIPFLGPFLASTISSNLIVTSCINILQFIISDKEDSQLSVESLLQDTLVDVLLFSLGKLFKLMKVVARMSKICSKFATKMQKIKIFKKLYSKSKNFMKARKMKLQKNIKNISKNSLKLPKKMLWKVGLQLGEQIARDLGIIQEIQRLVTQFLSGPIKLITQNIVDPIFKKTTQITLYLKKQLNNLINNGLDSIFGKEQQKNENNENETLIIVIEVIKDYIQEKIRKLMIIFNKRLQIIAQIISHISNYWKYGLGYYIGQILNNMSTSKTKIKHFILELPNLLNGQIKNKIQEAINKFKELCQQVQYAFNICELITEIQNQITLTLTEINNFFNKYKINDLKFLIKNSIRIKLEEIIQNIVDRNPFTSYLNRKHIYLNNAEQTTKYYVTMALDKIRQFILKAFQKIKKSNQSKKKQRENKKEEMMRYCNSAKGKNQCVIEAIQILFHIESKRVFEVNFNLDINDKGVTLTGTKEILLMMIDQSQIEEEQAKQPLRETSNSALNKSNSVAGLALLNGEPAGHAFCIQLKGKFKDMRLQQKQTFIKEASAKQLNKYNSGYYLVIKKLTEQKRMQISKRLNKLGNKRKRQTLLQFNPYDQIFGAKLFRPTDLYYLDEAPNKRVVKIKLGRQSSNAYKVCNFLRTNLINLNLRSQRPFISIGALQVKYQKMMSPYIFVAISQGSYVQQKRANNLQIIQARLNQLSKKISYNISFCKFFTNSNNNPYYQQVAKIPLIIERYFKAGKDNIKYRDQYFNQAINGLRLNFLYNVKGEKLTPHQLDDVMKYCKGCAAQQMIIDAIGNIAIFGKIIDLQMAQNIHGNFFYGKDSETTKKNPNEMYLAKSCTFCQRVLLALCEY